MLKNLDIINSKKVNIEEIEGLVVSLLDNQKSVENLILQQTRMKALCDVIFVMLKVKMRNKLNHIRLVISYRYLT